MNDQDLERQLRSQKSPREEGYTPAPLPATLEAARANRAPARILRAGMFAGAAAAGALAVAVVAVILSGPSHNGVGGGTSPSPSASVSASPGVCAPGDVTLTAEPWGGAAGSRGTVVTVALASGHDPCMLGRGLAAEMTDGNGSVLATTPAQSGGWVALASGASFTIGIAWSNWCAAAGDALNEDVGLGPLRGGTGPDRWRRPGATLHGQRGGHRAQLDGPRAPAVAVRATGSSR